MEIAKEHTYDIKYHKGQQETTEDWQGTYHETARDHTYEMSNTARDHRISEINWNKER